MYIQLLIKHSIVQRLRHGSEYPAEDYVRLLCGGVATRLTASRSQGTARTTVELTGER